VGQREQALREPGITADELAALEEVDEALVVVDVSGSNLLMNGLAEKIFGVQAEDVVGESHELLVPEGLQWGHQAYRRGYFAEPSPRWMDPGLDPHGQRPDGSLVPVSVWLEPRRLDGSLVVVAHVSERNAAVGCAEG
jgi:PAS domain S-box-containing protein